MEHAGDESGEQGEAARMCSELSQLQISLLLLLAN